MNLRVDLGRLLKRHAKGDRPTQEMVATMAFVTGYLFAAMSDGDLSKEDLELFIPSNVESGFNHALEGRVNAAGGRA